MTINHCKCVRVEMNVLFSIVITIIYLTKFSHACPSKPKLPPRKVTVLNCVRYLNNNFSPKEMALTLNPQ